MFNFFTLPFTRLCQDTFNKIFILFQDLQKQNIEKIKKGSLPNLVSFKYKTIIQHKSESRE